MHEKAINKIRSQILNALRNCNVSHGWSVYESYRDNILKVTTEILKHKRDWLTVSNIFSIFRDKVNLALPKAYDQQNDVSGHLHELLSEEKISSLSEVIVNYIESIPRTYLIYIPLPGLDKLGEEIIELSEGLSIRCYDRVKTVPTGDSKDAPYFSKALYGLFEPQKLLPKRSYLCVQEIGYAGEYPEDSAFMQAFSKLKQFVHLGFMRHVFAEINRTPLSLALLGSDQQALPLHAISFDQNKRDVVCSSVLIPRNIATYIDKVGLNVESQGYKQIKEQGNSNYAEYIRHNFNLPAKLITCSPNNKYATVIKTAIEWAFEAASNENETLAFINTCIGLEAILGDENGRESLTETLADRCAYLIGTNLEKRSEIKVRFKELYNLRSKLVHGRAVRLRDEEKFFLDWGKTLLDYVILKEMKNLNIDAKT